MSTSICMSTALSDNGSQRPQHVSFPQFDSPKITLDQLEYLTPLGKGTYGTVMKVRHRTTGTHYALKQTEKWHPSSTRIQDQEENILTRIQHPNIVGLHGAFDDEDGHRFLVLDYLPGPDLLSMLTKAPGNRIQEKVAKRYVAQIALALSHVQENHNVLHRDIKLDNIVLDGSGNAVLVDFGLSSIVVPGVAQTATCGTLCYLAPEVLDQRRNGGYSYEADWWSLGITAYVLVTGCYPFLCKTSKETSRVIRKALLSFPQNVPITSECEKFLRGLLDKDPQRRISTLVQVRDHPWMKDVDWTACMSACNSASSSPRLPRCPRDRSSRPSSKSNSPVSSVYLATACGDESSNRLSLPTLDSHCSNSHRKSRTESFSAVL